MLSREIKSQADVAKLNVEIFEADYGQINQVINDSLSSLYEFCPNVITMLHSVEVIREEFYQLSFANRNEFSIKKIAELQNLISTINQNLPDARVIVGNLAELQDGVYGNGANKYANSFLYAIRKYNLGLMELAQNNGNLHVLDIALLQSQIGRERFYDPRLYINASMSFSVDSHELIAKNIIDLMRVFQGGAKKCLILDLDNTLWGGIIGDDGIEKITKGLTTIEEILRVTKTESE